MGPARHNEGRGLVVHFSAFSRDWDDARAHRGTLQGYFHRLRMLGNAVAHNWLFACDEFGLT